MTQTDQAGRKLRFAAVAILSLIGAAEAAGQSTFSESCADAIQNFQNADSSPCLDRLPTLSTTEQQRIVDDYLINGRTYIADDKIETLIADLSTGPALRLRAVQLGRLAATRTPGADTAIADAMEAAEARGDQLAIGYLHYAKAELARIARDTEGQRQSLERAGRIADQEVFPGLQARVFYRSGEALHLEQRRQSAREILRKALRTFHKNYDFNGAGDACRLTGYVILRDEAIDDDALRHLTEAALRNDPAALPCYLFAAMHRANLHRAGMDEVVRLAQEAMDAAKAQRYVTMNASILNTLAINAKRNGDYVGAAEYYQDAVDAYEAIGNQFMVAGISSNMGVLLVELGDTETAIEILKRSLSIIEDVAPHRFDGILKSQNQIGKALAKSGRHEDALVWFTRALRTSESQPFRKFDGLVNAEYAKSLYEVGDQGKALAIAVAAGDSMLEHGDGSEDL
ncbi:MAG: tetratricopeptide repeat protein, partial [Pseudomonadota bacterium]